MTDRCVECGNPVEPDVNGELLHAGCLRARLIRRPVLPKDVEVAENDRFLKKERTALVRMLASINETLGDETIRDLRSKLDVGLIDIPFVYDIHRACVRFRKREDADGRVLRSRLPNEGGTK